MEGTAVQRLTFQVQKYRQLLDGAQSSRGPHSITGGPIVLQPPKTSHIISSLYIVEIRAAYLGIQSY